MDPASRSSSTAHGAPSTRTQGSPALPESAEAAPLFHLYFLRHAPAGNRAEWEGPDDARPLTDKGRKRMKRTGKALRDIIGTPDAILASPYARAQETAELVAKSLRFSGSVELNDHLVHGGQPDMLSDILSSHAGEKDLVLVGHSPDLERWIAHVTTGHAEAPFLELKKGGVARVDITDLTPEPRGVLRWCLTPGLLDSIE